MTLAVEMARLIAREIDDRSLGMIGAINRYCDDENCPLGERQRVALASAPIYAFGDLTDWLEQHLAGLRLDTDAPIERIRESDGA